MTTAVKHQDTPLDAEDVRRITTSWPGLLDKPPLSPEEASEMAATIRRLGAPAPTQWMLGRVSALLSHYFVSSAPTEMFQAIASDWGHELRGFPAWSINAACRWWVSGANDDRRRKPLPGDISHRARIELGPVKCGLVLVQRVDPDLADALRREVRI